LFFVETVLCRGLSMYPIVLCRETVICREVVLCCPILYVGCA
jgi:hypothetical protein